MSIFNNKLDYKNKDSHLHLKFDPDTLEYAFYVLENGIWSKQKVNDLSRRTKKVLELENKKLKEDKDKLNNELKIIKSVNRFHTLKSLGFAPTSFEIRSSKPGSISDELYDYLLPILEQDDHLIGISRVYSTDSNIEDTFENGFSLTGHSSSGAGATPELSYNVSYYSDNMKIINELEFANAYKNSNGSFLFDFPFEDLENKENLYVEYNDGSVRINPKYVIGFVPCDESHNIDTIIKRSDYLENNKTR